MLDAGAWGSVVVALVFGKGGIWDGGCVWVLLGGGGCGACGEEREREGGGK